MSFVSTKSGLLLPKESVDSAKKTQVAKLGRLSIWARNGFVCMSKELDNGEEEFSQIETKVAAERLSAVAEDTKMMETSASPHYDRIRMNKRFMHIFEAVIKQAQEQGPYEYEDMRRDRVRRRPVSVSIPKMPQS